MKVSVISPARCWSGSGRRLNGRYASGSRAAWVLCVKYLYSVISQFKGLNMVRGDVSITHLMYLTTSRAKPLLCLVPTEGELVMVSTATGGVTNVVSETVSGTGVDLASILLVTPNGAVVDVVSYLLQIAIKDVVG